MRSLLKQIESKVKDKDLTPIFCSMTKKRDYTIGILEKRERKAVSE